MTTEQLSIHDDDPAGRQAQLERALEVILSEVLEHAAGAAELAPGDFQACLVSIRHLASEIRWLNLGQQPVPF